MGILEKLTGSKNKQADSMASSATEAPPCPHLVLTTRWDRAEDMGHEDRASYYVCESCGEKFTPDEAEALRLA